MLHYIPMAALYDPAAKKYLVEKYASAIHYAHERLHARQISRREERQPTGNGPFRPVRRAFFHRSENVLCRTRLDCARSQSLRIAWASRGNREWLNNDFTAANLKEQLKSGKYQLVHLASHFDAQAGGDATKSFLLMAGDESGGGAGFHLTLDALRHDPGFHMSRVELLTFSACKTAVAAKATDGHEVDGLAGVGHKLGAKAVMASLWEVDDASTSKLMGDFYQRWAGSGAPIGKAEALRQAQLDLLLGKDRPQEGGVDRGFGQAKSATGSASRATRTLTTGRRLC